MCYIFNMLLFMVSYQSNNESLLDFMCYLLLQIVCCYLFEKIDHICCECCVLFLLMYISHKNKHTNQNFTNHLTSSNEPHIYKIINLVNFV